MASKDPVKNDIHRLRSELRQSEKKTKEAFDEIKLMKKNLSAFTGVSGNYWTQTGMPWVKGEGRKAVMTEYFWQPIRGQPRRVDTNELRQFSQDYWVAACVKTFMDEICSLEWDIVPKKDFQYEWVKEPLEKVRDFFKHPNKNGEPFSHILGALTKDVLEIDAGVLVKVFDVNSYDFDNIEPKSGAPQLKPQGQRNMVEIYARDGASFLKEMDKFGFELGYWQYSYQIPAHPMWFNKDEIVYVIEHPRSMSPYGYARTQSIMDILKSLHYSIIYNKKFFEETAIPDGSLSMLDTSEEDLQKFRDYWNNDLKAQPHKLAIVNKDMKWQPFNISNREMEFLDSQKWYFNMIISAFGLSPSELGITDDLNRSTSATQAELVKRKGIRPFLGKLEDYINEGIVKEFGFEGIEFQFIYDDPAEHRARLDNWEKELNMGVKTVNEVRKELGLEPIAGGDVGNNLTSMMNARNVPGQGSVGNTMPSPEENQQAQGYQGELHGQEGGKKQDAGAEKERDAEIKKPYAEDRRMKGAGTKQVSLEELIVEHKKLVDALQSKDPKKLQQELEDQKKELEQYILEAKKGVDDGQYYRDQPIAQPRRLSGANVQPQNQPRDTMPKNTWNEINSPDTNPSDLGSSRAKPGVDTFNSNQGQISCPVCGQNTLAYLNSQELLQDDIRCTNCGGRFRSADFNEGPLADKIRQTLEQNNSSQSVTTKGACPECQSEKIRKA